VADRLYLLAPVGLIDPREVPQGWGLLECERRWSGFERMGLVELSDAPVRVTIEAPLREVRPAWRQRMLRSIAVSLTRQAVLGTGLASRPMRSRSAARL
jgi:hypothetical protein